MASLLDNLQDATNYDDMNDGSVDDLIAYKDALEDAIATVEQLLRQNARGNLSAADVMGELWSFGFDPDVDA